MELLKTLGFDPIMLGAQILNFLIIFYLLKRFLYKPVMDMVKSREDKITLGLKQAEEARLKLEETIEEEKRILSRAQTQARELLEDSKNQASAIAAQIQENARITAEKTLIEAKNQMNQEALGIEKRISEKISVVAVEMLTRSIKGIFSDKEQKTIVTKALKSIKRID